MTGYVFGSYKILDRLGEGGMGTVYRGLDLMLDRTVAVKVLRPELAGNADLVERFRTEAKAVARLHHPNVAGVYALQQEGDHLFLVMEFISGETLEHRLRRVGRLHPAEAVGIVGQALAGLSHAHAQGVVHRDIKPANLMITQHGGVKIMDFGIARLLGSQRMTRTRFAVGTAEYMAPEQVQGRDVDGRTDLYALGIVLYEALTGQVPFQSDSEFELMRAQVEHAPPQLRTRLADAPDALETILDRALAKEPDQRFAHAGDFREALLAVDLPLPPRREAAATRVVATPPVAPPERPPAPTRVATDPTPREPAPAMTDTAPTFAETAHVAAATPAPARSVPAWMRRPLVWGAAAVVLLLAVAVPFLLPDASGGATDPNAAATGLDASTISEPNAAVPGFAPQPLPASPANPLTGTPGQLHTAALLATAERFFARDQLTSPADSNTLDVVARVLAVEPTNPSARGLVRRVVEKYVAWGTAQQRRNRYADASRHYRAALQVTTRFPAAAGDMARSVQTVLAAAASLAAQDPTPQPPSADEGPAPATHTGTLRILVRPFGDVYLDGKQLAAGTNAPVTANLPPGRYRVRVVHPTLGSAERTVEIRSGREEDVRFTLIATLSVTSNPSNARIIVDGQLTDRYTPARLTLAPGTYTIRVERDGYRTAEQRVEVDASREARVAFSLEAK